MSAPSVLGSSNRRHSLRFDVPFTITVLRSTVRLQDHLPIGADPVEAQHAGTPTLGVGAIRALYRRLPSSGDALRSFGIGKCRVCSGAPIQQISNAFHRPLGRSLGEDSYRPQAAVHMRRRSDVKAAAQLHNRSLFLVDSHRLLR